MRLTVTHVHILDEGQAERLLDFLDLRLGKFNRKLERMMSLLDDLQAKADSTLTAVRENNVLDDSIIAIVTANAQTIKDLKAALDAAGTDPTKLQALSDTMDQIASQIAEDTEKTSEAVTANTEVENPPAEDGPAKF